MTKKLMDKLASEKIENSNVVLIGMKPVMNYIVACVTFLNQGVNSITLKARGNAISKAVDAVELLKRAFVKDLIINDIKIGTEVVQRENRSSKVSSMEISIEKPIKT